MTTTTGDAVSLTEAGRFARLDALFGSLVGGDYDAFLAGCTDELVLNVRGSAQTATTVRKSELAEWHRSTGQLAGDAFRSSVCFVLVAEYASCVVLTHVIERNGQTYRYETVNHCTLRGELLASWFSYPMDVADYAEAWGVRTPGDAQCAV